MSTAIPSLSLFGAVVGQVFTVDLSKTLQNVPQRQEAGGFWGTLNLHNESGALLVIAFPSGAQFNLPSNAWVIGTKLASYDTSFTVTVLAIRPQATTGLLVGTYYPIYETADAIVPGAESSITQQRVVTIPLSPIVINARAIAVTAGLDVIDRTDNFSPVPSGTFAYTVNAYLYYFNLTPQGPPTTQLYAVDATLFADLMNGGAVLASAALYQCYVLSANVVVATANPTIFRDEFYPTEAANVFIPGNTPPPITGVRWRLHINNVAGTPTIFYNYGVGMDNNNNVSPGTIGNFTSPSVIF